MSKRRVPTWLLLILVPAVLLLVGVPALWVFMSVTATPLHPSADGVPSMMYATPSPKWEEAATQGRQSVKASVAEQNLPGVSVAVGIDGDVVWAEGFGFADLRTSTPVTPGSRFRIGTASTVLTSAAAGLLLEDGSLKLDDQIQRYVPAFPRKQWPVMLRQLMGHTAGLISDGGDEGPLFRKHCERPEEALQAFVERPLLFQPGTQYRYSRYGWIVVSAAIEAAAGQPFLTFMRERIFDRLGMRDTVADGGPDPAAVEGEDFPPIILFRELFYDPEAKRSAATPPKEGPAQSQVTSYFPRFAAKPKYGLHLTRWLDYSCYAGSSVFVSTPSDLVRFAMAVNDGKLLKPATVELLQASQRLASGVETGYGLGWDLETVTLAGNPTRVIGHDGDSLGGMVASLMTFPEYGVTVAVTSNISYADTAAIGLKVAEAFAQQAASPAQK